MKAAKLVIRDGWSTRKVARHTGFNQSTIVRWVKKARVSNRLVIPTESSRPNRHPNQLSEELVSKIVEVRLRSNRCAEVVHEELKREGWLVSLSSVKRTLKREGLIKHRSPWKRWHFSESRPLVHQPGDLIQIDTIHLIPGNLYVYTLIDVCSRWAWARVSERINTHRSLLFAYSAKDRFPCPFKILQSDHGSEFSTYFSENVKEIVNSALPKVFFRFEI